MSNKKLFLHQRTPSKAVLSDEYETPHHLIPELSEEFNIFPKIDVCSANISKCDIGLKDGLVEEWNKDVWCNPPHSENKKWINRANQQWKKHNINILMIVPANAITAKYFDETFNKGYATYHRISKRLYFLVDGKPMKDHSRNGYFVVIWRKRNDLD